MKRPDELYHEAMSKLAKLDDTDPARSHREADLIILDYLRAIGEPQIALAFEDARRRIGFWYA